jgi:hypothetical protein
MTASDIMPAELTSALKSYFNIVGTTNFVKFDHDWDQLKNFFRQTRKETFDPLDRYIIQHQDTDIYISECSVGINLRNFFQVIQSMDIPVYTLIIWTNHIGLQQEIDILCKNQHPLDRPTLIESFCTTTHVGTEDYYNDWSISADQIEIHALSMMGANRSHRFAFYNSLKHIDKNKLALSIKGSRV